MKCIARDCDHETVKDERFCDNHIALIIKFRKAFNNPQLATEALNFIHPSFYPIIDVNYTNLSKEIALQDKIK